MLAIVLCRLGPDGHNFKASRICEQLRLLPSQPDLHSASGSGPWDEASHDTGPASDRECPAAARVRAGRACGAHRLPAACQALWRAVPGLCLAAALPAQVYLCAQMQQLQHKVLPSKFES